jgi:hypothetical protein
LHSPYLANHINVRKGGPHVMGAVKFTIAMQF